MQAMTTQTRTSSHSAIAHLEAPRPHLTALKACGAFALARYLSRRSLIVLTYHHVLSTRLRGSLARRPDDAVYADEFDAQISHLRRHHHIVTGPQFQRFLSGEPLPQHSVLVTFDDGYLNNFTDAFPILRRHDATAIFFLTTGFLDEPSSRLWLERFDAAAASCRPSTIASVVSHHALPLEPASVGALRRLLKRSTADVRDGVVRELERCAGAGVPPFRSDTAPMSWTQAREMASAGMTLGGHTASHQVLAGTDVVDAKQEVVRCRERIQQELDTECWAFSFPNGERSDFREADKASLRESGYLCAFTQIDGFVTRESDRFALPRVPMPASGDFDVFLSRASGLYSGIRCVADRVQSRAA